MYKQFKALAKKIIPNNFLFKNELFFRSFHALFYKGTAHQCTICDHKIRKFIVVFNSPQQCPYCGSLARTRRLFHLLQTEIGLTGTVLHFSPSRPLYRKLRALKAITYHSTDFENEFLADYRYDITNIPIADSYFDRIICYHILEHIIDDQKAMRELFRVLKPGGKVVIQTPFKTGEIYENAAITSTEDRLEHFGQEDHVRVYSIKGLSERLRASGFEKISIKNFDKQNDFTKIHGFLEQETLLIIQK